MTYGSRSSSAFPYLSSPSVASRRWERENKQPLPGRRGQWVSASKRPILPVRGWVCHRDSHELGWRAGLRSQISSLPLLIVLFDYTQLTTNAASDPQTMIAVYETGLVSRLFLVPGRIALKLVDCDFKRLRKLPDRFRTRTLRSGL